MTIEQIGNILDKHNVKWSWNGLNLLVLNEYQISGTSFSAWIEKDFTREKEIMDWIDR